MTKEKIQVFTYRISQANKTEMMTILYDMAAEYISDAISSLEKQNLPDFRTNISRAKDVLRELKASVNTQTELGMKFLSLYIFYSEQLTKAYVDYDKAPAEHVLKMLKILSETYAEISKKDNSGAVMGNAETVYSGLTYNRYMTADSMSDTSGNRGFLA